MSYHVYQDAPNKQQTQYQLITMSKWKMHHLCWKLRNQIVLMFGYVYRNINDLNHGPVWKTQSFLLSEICAIILLQDYYGKDKPKKFYWITIRKKVPDWEYSFVNREKEYSFLFICTTENWLERNKTLTQCGKFLWKTLIWENRHHSVTMFIWITLNENVKQVKILWRITEIWLNPKSLLGLQKSFLILRIFDANNSSFFYDRKVIRSDEQKIIQ